MMRVAIWPMLTAALWPAMVSAQEVASAGLGLTIMQAGGTVPIFRDTAQIDPVTMQTVQLAAAPFGISLPQMTCAPELDGTFVRIHLADRLPQVLTHVNDALANDSNALEAIFPPGFGMAADVGPQTTLMMHNEPPSLFEQGFNYFFEDRFAARENGLDLLQVNSVLLADHDLLAQGDQFIMVLGRHNCADPAAAPLIDVFNVAFGGA